MSSRRAAPSEESCIRKAVDERGLNSGPVGLADAISEDEAADSFCRAATQGRFPRLDDRDDLWRLLVALTERKLADQMRRARRLKRGGRRVRTEGDLAASGSDNLPAGLNGIAGSEPTPEFAAEFAEEYRRLFEILRDEDLRRIAVWKLEGHTVDEIAAQLGCARRTGLGGWN